MVREMERKMIIIWNNQNISLVRIIICYYRKLSPDITTSVTFIVMIVKRFIAHENCYCCKRSV